MAGANAALIDLEPYHRQGLGSLASSTINQVGLGVGALAAGLAADHLCAPTRTAYAAHVVVVALALVALAFVPETAPRTTTFSVRPTAPTLPIEHHAALFAASAAGFAAFAFCGLWQHSPRSSLGMWPTRIITRKLAQPFSRSLSCRPSAKRDGHASSRAS